jgi:small subunit ribosomal protein S8
MLTDPIADMLTRIRNAVRAHKESVELPSSKMKRQIAELLRQEGFIAGVEEIERGPGKVLRITLQYGKGNEPAISGIRRISKPGLRVYVGVDEIPRVRGGLGTTILSTPKGVMTDRTARKERVGGEVICTVW